MSVIEFPYGKEQLSYDFSNENFLGSLTSSLHHYKAEKGQSELVLDALSHPIGSKPLHELAQGKKKVVLIASDHTRPVPSKHIVPWMLEEIRKGNPDAEITILIATGCHRAVTREELIQKFGEEIVERETIVVHDCDDEENLVNIGTLPSGSACRINRLAAEADLLVSEGFIEPHFFAGFSGGRKSVLPGVASRETVVGNHCSEFIASEYARTGILENNPIHKDMCWAAEHANLRFIVNVVINSKKEAIFAVAGDPFAAHQKGCEFLNELCGVEAKPADVVITTNGGYPLDQNIYQAVKGMTAGEATVREGGVIILLAKSNDGHGGDAFFHQLSDEEDFRKTMALFLSRGRKETVPDQWQSQIFFRILERARVIYMSDAPDEMVSKMHLIPVHSIEEALSKAKELLGNDHPSIVAIPDGVSVIVR